MSIEQEVKQAMAEIGNLEIIEKENFKQELRMKCPPKLAK